MEVVEITVEHVQTKESQSAMRAIRYGVENLVEGITARGMSQSAMRAIRYGAP